jgi:hypothetical protein
MVKMFVLWMQVVDLMRLMMILNADSDFGFA